MVMIQTLLKYSWSGLLCQNLSDLFFDTHQSLQTSAFDTLAQIASIAAIALNFHGIVDSPDPPDPQFAANQANISSFLGNYVRQTRQSLETAYANIFDNGANVTTLLQGRSLVNRTALNLDCSNCIAESQGWMELYLTLKMINYMWWTQGVFVTFMPYGKVLQVDTKDKVVDFDESSCASNFLPQDSLTVCHTDDWGWGSFLGPGMARLTWNNPDCSSPSVLNLTCTNTYTFNFRDAIESSVRGWIKGGYLYDGVAANATSAIKSTALAPDQLLASLQGLQGLTASSAGVFSLPVCVIRDLNAWPTYYGVDGRCSENT
ncbi:hypothetical protein MMC22_011818 [Lobaria immixta]|nr:hypothetical protein [Lobaria immixta]